MTPGQKHQAVGKQAPAGTTSLTNHPSHPILVVRTSCSSWSWRRAMLKAQAKPHMMISMNQK